MKNPHNLLNKFLPWADCRRRRALRAVFLIFIACLVFAGARSGLAQLNWTERTPQAAGGSPPPDGNPIVYDAAGGTFSSLQTEGRCGSGMEPSGVRFPTRYLRNSGAQVAEGAMPLPPTPRDKESSFMVAATNVFPTRRSIFQTSGNGTERPGSIAPSRIPRTPIPTSVREEGQATPWPTIRPEELPSCSEELSTRVVALVAALAGAKDRRQSSSMTSGNGMERAGRRFFPTSTPMIPMPV